MRRLLLPLQLIIASSLGILIAWVDSRPTWDDTGITAGVILLVTAVFGALDPAHAWVWALAVGAWVPLIGIFQHNHYGSLIALAIAVLGAFGGALARRLLAPVRPG